MRAVVSACTALHCEWGGIQSRMARRGEVFLVVRILDCPYPTLRCLGSPLSYSGVPCDDLADLAIDRALGWRQEDAEAVG